MITGRTDVAGVRMHGGAARVEKLAGAAREAAYEHAACTGSH